jgi:hypothetical protein
MGRGWVLVVKHPSSRHVTTVDGGLRWKRVDECTSSSPGKEEEMFDRK